jgi:hypothetical protein
VNFTQAFIQLYRQEMLSRDYFSGEAGPLQWAAKNSVEVLPGQVNGQRPGLLHPDGI